MADSITLFGKLPEVRRPWTADDYLPEHPRHNAAVFADVWHRDIHGIDDCGLFEAGSGSAGTMTFRDVVESIKETDRQRKLSQDDLENAAAMVYHLTPKFAGHAEWKPSP